MIRRWTGVGVMRGGMFAVATALLACGDGTGGATTADAASSGGGPGSTDHPTSDGSGAGVSTGGSTAAEPTTGDPAGTATTTGTTGTTTAVTATEASVSTGSTGSTGDEPQVYDVEPSTPQELAVGIGEQTPTIMYAATANGQPFPAEWAVDRPEIGTVEAGPADATTFVPTGLVGGVVILDADLAMMNVERSIFVKLSGEQNGFDPDEPAEQPQIAVGVAGLLKGGGTGGVGGEGLGPAVVDPATLDALDAPAGDGSEQHLRFLYPYDATVWPRGLPAPLLMWDSSLGDVDAIRIDLVTTTSSLTWKGTFARPAILGQTGGSFVRHPIPQDIWDIASNTAGGPDQLTVKLTVAKDGLAYGPITRTWTFAGARLTGRIDYTSYGVELVQNYGGALGGNGQFGGSIVSVRVGDTTPKVIAGASGNESKCRSCHSASADGSRLIAQRGDNYTASALYDLTPQDTVESALALGATYPAMYPDGSMALRFDGKLLPLPDDAVPLAASGLMNYVTHLGTPAFAPDGARLVFNPFAGAGLTNPRQKLVVMSFDPGTLTFAAPIEVADYSGQPAEQRPGWPSFLPDSNSVVYHAQIAPGFDGNNQDALATRKGARAYLAWTGADAANMTPLARLNGRDANDVSYLPVLAQPPVINCQADGLQVGKFDPAHADDTNYNYTPTVNPVAAGGYAWVVFTSRRMYGNLATLPPFCSDPRGVDLFKNISPKKLWVAAIDLDAKPGTDASHPAFYLPGQELVGSNAHGTWSREACQPAGDPCSAGVDCCGGFCQPADVDGPPVCLDTLPDGACSRVTDKCSTADDCCDGTQACINGVCTVPAPN